MHLFILKPVIQTLNGRTVVKMDEKGWADINLLFKKIYQKIIRAPSLANLAQKTFFPPLSLNKRINYTFTRLIFNSHPINGPFPNSFKSHGLPHSLKRKTTPNQVEQLNINRVEWGKVGRVIPRLQVQLNKWSGGGTGSLSHLSPSYTHTQVDGSFFSSYSRLIFKCKFSTS